MKLVFTNGDEKGREVDLKPPFISIGREMDNDVVLPYDAISRYHAKIEKDGNIWVIRDLESSNGVRVNGQKINESSPITHKDEVRISDYSFVIRDESVGDDETERKTAFNIGPGLKDGEEKKDEGGGHAADTAVQKMIRLGVVAICTVLILTAIYYLLVDPESGNEQKVNPQALRKARLKKSPLKIFFREERFGKDPKTGEHNVFVYKASVMDSNLNVSVRNVADNIDKPNEQVELLPTEIDRLKDILADDHFVDVKSPSAKEPGSRYERIQLMIMAGNRGNFVEYVNVLHEMPPVVIGAIDRLKTIIEARLQIPKLTYEEAVKESERLYRLADRKYKDRRVDPLNLYQAVNYAADGIRTIEGYSKEPPFLQSLQLLKKQAETEYRESIDILKRDAALAVRSKKYDKALGYYKEIKSRIGSSADPDYMLAAEGVTNMQEQLRRGPRKR